MNQTNAHSASLYDLQPARQFLKLLNRKPEAGHQQPPELPAAGYARLAEAAGALAGVNRGNPGAEAGATGTEVLPVPELTCWEDFLAWCAPLTRAEAAFVVDSQGFIIANRGRIPEEGFDGAGAEMICSVEQLQRIAPDAGEVSCIDIDFDKRRIIGFVTTSEQTVQYAVVLVAPGLFASDLKGRIIRQLLQSLPDLD